MVSQLCNISTWKMCRAQNFKLQAKTNRDEHLENTAGKMGLLPFVPDLNMPQPTKLTECLKIGNYSPQANSILCGLWAILYCGLYQEHIKAYRQEAPSAT